MEGLDAETLRRLLSTYEAAISELQAMRDAAVEGLMQRLARHRAEVIGALAALHAEGSASHAAATQNVACGGPVIS